jgi:GTP-binding protein
MTPVIAIVGRPNVGKSTLFNRLTRSRAALVANYAGLTRDRIYGNGTLDDRNFIVIDTGGISGDEEGIDSLMAGQSLQAMVEADCVLFLVDAQSGLTAADQMIASHLRKTENHCFLVVNKVDGRDPDVVSAEFHELGMSHLYTIAASQNRGVRQLMVDVLAAFDTSEQGTPAGQSHGTRIAVIGRPNVGKSTLVNRLLGEDRVVVYDQPGTTRDSIYIPYMRHDKPYTLIDTAGIRRRKNIKETIEKFSIIKTLKAIDDAQVVIALFDAREGIVDQDLHVLSFALRAGRALVIAVNKWDGMTVEDKDKVRKDIARRLDFVRFAKIKFISALHGTAVGDLYKAVDQAYLSASSKWTTNKLTGILETSVAEHMPPLVNGRRIKLRYAHQGGSCPPRVIVHGNQTEALPNSYKRYLENSFRKALKIEGTPVFMEFKTGKNPFEGRKNVLSTRQIQKKRRLVSHTKKGR